MDPQACLERWRDATLAGRAAESREAMRDLAGWLRNGGFWPVGMYASERDALRRKYGLVQRVGSTV